MDFASTFLTHLLAFLFLTLALMVAGATGLSAGRGDPVYARTGIGFSVLCASIGFALQVLA